MKAQTNYLLSSFAILLFLATNLSAQDKYLKTINSVGYNNNDGSQNFSLFGTNNNDHVIATCGRLRINSNQLCFRNDDNRWLYRVVPLAGSANAQLRITYDATSGDTGTSTTIITDKGSIESNEIFSVSFTPSTDCSVNISDTTTVTIIPQIFSDEPLSLIEEFYGNLDYVFTGNTLRMQDDSADPSVITTASSTMLFSPIPTIGTFRSAYLSSSIDGTVTFGVQTVNADTGYVAISDNFNSYRGDVTTIVNTVLDSNTKTFDFTDLTVETATYRGSTVLGGRSLFIIYDEDSLPVSSFKLFQGFEFFQNNSELYMLDYFYALIGIGAKATILSCKGDEGLSGTTEEFFITNGASTKFTLSGDEAQTGNSAYNSTIYDNTQTTFYSVPNIYGFNLDTYDISSYISSGDTQITASVSVDGSASDTDGTTNTYTDINGNTNTTNGFKYLIPIDSGGLSDLITATATVYNTTSEFTAQPTIKAASG